MIFRRYGTTYQSVDMDFAAEALNELADRPWGEIGRGGTPLTQHRLATLLRTGVGPTPAGSSPKPMRVNPSRCADGCTVAVIMAT